MYPKHVFWLRNKIFSVTHSAVKIIVAGRHYREICDFRTIIKNVQSRIKSKHY